MKPSDNTSQQTIAVLGDTDFAFSMQVLEGVQNFASRAPAWRVLPLHCTQDDVLDDLLRQGRLDGVIGAFISERWVTGLPGRPVPLVNVGGQSLLAHTTSVLPDDRAIGRLAADHLLEGGWRVLGCLHDPTSHAACQRREGFIAAAASHGLKVSSPPPSESFAITANWETWLRSLHPPAAIFCTSDLLARRVINLLQRLDAHVPESFAVVGVGDSAFDSVLAGMGISSVALPGRSMGQRAAARLHAMLTTGKRDTAVEYLPPETLVVRESSALVRTRDAVVSRAVGLMLQHPAESFSTSALARRVGLSRRALEMRFQHAIGHGPATEMRQRRMTLAQRLLADTTLSLEQIAERAGFCGAHHLAARFKKESGLTAGTYRRQKQRMPPSQKSASVRP
jgi:LacI family transcriptional regulator